MILVLASTSPYRRELLARLINRFITAAPNVDETPLPAEQAVTLARRLARDKARSVARQHAGAIVIGSDQVAELDGQPVGKPGTLENARRQLRAASGRDMRFHTAVHIVAADGAEHEALDMTRVRFRPLHPDDIDVYLERDTPFDCAGSFRCEGLGIALFERIETDDPTALIGLPLIATSRLLRAAGLDPLRPEATLSPTAS